jgi:hypothetical protein
MKAVGFGLFVLAESLIRGLVQKMLRQESSCHAAPSRL